MVALTLISPTAEVVSFVVLLAVRAFLQINAQAVRRTDVWSVILKLANLARNFTE